MIYFELKKAYEVCYRYEFLNSFIGYTVKIKLDEIFWKMKRNGK